MFAPARRRARVAVLDDGTADGALAAHEIAAAIARGWAGYRVVAAQGDPAASDCRAKPYAAVVRVTVTPLGADGRDVGRGAARLRRLERRSMARARCGARAPRSTRCSACASGRASIRRWRPRCSSAGSRSIRRRRAPTYFYVLFKPVDGYMRALVRPGGPAYAAGLRTGDVIDKLDGRFWWEYGTYQTQLRAYDGKPHDFDVERGARRRPARSRAARRRVRGLNAPRILLVFCVRRTARAGERLARAPSGAPS